MFNQLFHTKPTANLLYKCINALGFQNLQDTNEIARITLEQRNVIAVFNNLKTDFVNIYIPCKYDVYCNSIIDIKTCITITKQILKAFNYDLISTECFICGKRMQKYKLMSAAAKTKLKEQKIQKQYNLLKIKQTGTPYLITFD